MENRSNFQHDKTVERIPLIQFQGPNLPNISPEPPLHTFFLGMFLSAGPVGPLSYLKNLLITFRCRGSVLGYLASPQQPSKYRYFTGVSSS